ncbi:MAG: hypothetical protein C0432_04095 [Candidatus Puniceispirillum sp.]|nr:hypothetical protein [Candidatus Puniceispirillum sp.]
MNDIDQKAKLFFDQDFYAKNYIIPHSFKGNAYDHFVQQGWKKGNKPNKDFDVRLYHAFFSEPDFFENYQRFLTPLHYYVYLKYFDSSLLKKNKINIDHIVKSVKKLDHPKYSLTVCAIFQNEARFLKEWIEFYLMQGVDHFYLYNHNSTDDFVSILKPYIEKGIVTLRHITINPKSSADWVRDVQSKTYFDLSQEIKDDVEWVMYLDIDEFLFPVKENTLKTILNDYDHNACVRVPWVFFGTGNVERVRSDQLVIQELDQAMHITDDSIATKFIVKPRYIKQITSPHFCNLILGYFAVDEDNQYVSTDDTLSPILTKKLRINHYYSRDKTFFNEVKLKRWRDALSSTHIQNQNLRYSLREDVEIKRFIPEMKKRMKIK